MFTKQQFRSESMRRRGQISITSTHVVSSEALENDPQGGSPEKESMPLATAIEFNKHWISVQQRYTL